MEQYIKGFKGFTPVKMCGLSHLASFYFGLWALKRVIHHIPLTGQKRYVTEQKWIWPVIVTEDYPKIILGR